MSKLKASLVLTLAVLVASWALISPQWALSWLSPSWFLLVLVGIAWWRPWGNPIVLAWGLGLWQDCLMNVILGEHALVNTIVMTVLLSNDSAHLGHASPQVVDGQPLLLAGLVALFYELLLALLSKSLHGGCCYYGLGVGKTMTTLVAIIMMFLVSVVTRSLPQDHPLGMLDR